jgi:hypothetical protein
MVMSFESLVQMGPQSGDHPQEDLAKCIYKLNLKIISENTSFCNFGYLLELCLEI